MNKVAILGSGKSAKNFIQAINKSKKFKLIQIGARNYKAAKQISLISNSDVEIKSINTIIKSKSNNLIIVCLPAFVQSKIVKSLLIYKKDIICEKPFVLKLKDAKDILSIWRKTKKICLINFCYNYLKPIKNALVEIKKNYSQIHTVKISWNVMKEIKNKQNWKNKNNLTGGVLFNYGSHLLNLFFPNKIKLDIINNKKNILYSLCKFSIKKKILYKFSLSNISKPPHGIKIELIGKKIHKIISNYGSTGPTIGYKLINKSIKSQNSNTKEPFHLDNKRKIELNDLYLKTLIYFDKIKKKRLRKYKNDINEGLWNTYLLETIQNKIKKNLQ